MKKVLLFLLLASCATNNSKATNEYTVASKDTVIVVDGTLDESIWLEITPIDKGLHFPWETTPAPMTVFKAFHDKEYFYFSFETEDTNVVIAETITKEIDIAREDRVELFFAQAPIDKPLADGSFPNYFALEMDYKGRTLSIKADSQKNRDHEWNMNTLETLGSRTEKGYILEGRIALAELQELGVINDNKMQTGVYRAEFSTVNGEEIMQWITWIDPKTEKPNFHINSSFGTFIIE